MSTPLGNYLTCQGGARSHILCSIYVVVSCVYSSIQPDMGEEESACFYPSITSQHVNDSGPRARDCFRVCPADDRRPGLF